MGDVIYLPVGAMRIKQEERDSLDYQAYLMGLNKLELLEEMVRFQEERSRIGQLTLAMMVKGRYLFKALEECAETEELRILTRSYRRHLDLELQEYRNRTYRESDLFPNLRRDTT